MSNSADHAVSDGTVLAHLKRKQTGAIDAVLGRYSDSFRLRERGWRITKVIFERLQ